MIEIIAKENDLVHIKIDDSNLIIKGRVPGNGGTMFIQIKYTQHNNPITITTQIPMIPDMCCSENGYLVNVDSLPLEKGKKYMATWRLRAYCSTEDHEHHRHVAIDLGVHELLSDLEPFHIDYEKCNERGSE